jgi:hypothetical protein
VSILPEEKNAEKTADKFLPGRGHYFPVQAWQLGMHREVIDECG